MKIRIHLYSQSVPMLFDAVAAYTKDGLYCMEMPNGDVIKFPYIHIFQIEELAPQGGTK